jgi:hypothetical protein
METIDKMPVKPEEKRNPDGTFGPGNNANPNGRPRKETTFSDIARTLLASREIHIEYTYPKEGRLLTSKLNIVSSNTLNHSLVAALIKDGLDGNVAAIKELIDRTEGKAQEYKDVTSGGDKLHNIIITVGNDKIAQELKDDLKNGL